MTDPITLPPDTPEYRRLLEEAAQQVGMEPGYWDIFGTWHHTTDEVRRAILGAIGIASRDEHELRTALEQRRRREWSSLAPRAIVADAASQPIEVTLRVPTPQRSGRVEVLIIEENQSRHSSYCELSNAPDADTMIAAGGEWIGKRTTLPVSLPPGYHTALFRLDGAEWETRLIVCPKRAWMPASLERGERRSGLAVSLYGVRGSRTWGCGDFTALSGVIDWVADRLGGAYIALNPLSAIHNRQPFNTSPYLPNSIFFRNFIYLDIDRVPDFEHSARARALRSSPAFEAEVASLNAAEFVEYERVAALKRAMLRLLYRGFYHREYLAGTERGRRFREWADTEGALLERFATYSAIDEYLHRRNPDVWVWQQWPEPLQDPNSEQVARFAAERPRTLLFHKYVQWLLDEQAAEAQRYARQRGLEIGLFHDLPLATDRCGFDLWANREFYATGCRVGAPPDDFSPKGQDWAFPPPNTEAHYADGYRLFAESIRRSARHGGALRIDHVMRLFRLYWIPDGFDATVGTYVRDRHEDLLRVLALESQRQQILIVGEDLGTVEPSMREALARFGILSYRLFYFEKNDRGEFKRPEEYPAHALVSSTTHDLPTLAGFWLGRDIDARIAAGLFPDDNASRQAREQRDAEKQKMLDVLFALGLLPNRFPRGITHWTEFTGELHNAITGFLASTPCLLMTLNQEDLTKETEQQNLPGTTWQYPNWRRKMKFSVEDLHHSPLPRDFAAMLRHWLDRTGRSAM